MRLGSSIQVTPWTYGEAVMMRCLVLLFTITPSVIPTSVLAEDRVTKDIAYSQFGGNRTVSMSTHPAKARIIPWSSGFTGEPGKSATRRRPDQAEGVQQAGLRPDQHQLPVPSRGHVQGASRGHRPGDPLGP